MTDYEEEQEWVEQHSYPHIPHHHHHHPSPHTQAPQPPQPPDPPTHVRRARPCSPAHEGCALNARRMEIEALEAIFDEEFKPDSEQPEKKFSVVINDLEFLSKEIVLDFKYPETYPDVPAEFDIQPTLQLTNDQKERVREAMAAAAAEEAGNAMVFAMVTAAKDWLTENFDADNEVEEQEKVVAPELTQEERGTPVTKENFIEWHAAFLAQMKAQGKWTEAAKQEGLTGRQLFEGGACVDMPL